MVSVPITSPMEMIYCMTERAVTTFLFLFPVKNRPEIASVTRAGGSLLFAWLQQIIVENKDGSESYYSSVQYMGEEDLLQTLNLQIHQGLAPREAMQKYDQPVYINRRER